MSTLSNSAHGSMRHARHGSDDQRKQMKQPKAATASPTSWRSVRLARSHSQTSEYSTDDELESPNLVPRFSASSTLTTLTTPRSSIPSPELPSKPPNTRIGQRVRVEHMGLTGTLRFLGTTQFKAGVWAGIELDTPGAGKNDGSVEGVKYFSCAPKSGIFVQSSKIIFEIPSKPRNTSSRFTPVSRPSRFQSSTDTPIALSKQKSMPSLRARYRQQQQQPQQHLSTSTRSATPAQSLSHGIPSPEITPTKCDLTTPSNQRDPRRIDEHRSNTIMEGGHVEKEDQDECLDCIQLQLDNTQLQADLAATKSKLAQVNEALSSNTELVMSYQERIENLENTIQELKHAGMETIELYEKSVQQHGIDAKCSAEKLAAAHDKLQSLEAERDSLLSAKEKLEQELEKRRKEKDDRVQDMEKTIHQLEQQLQQQQGNNKEEMEAIKSAWKSNVHDLEEQLALAKQDLETERTEHAATKEQVATMHGEIQQKYDALAKEFDEYRQSMESQQRSLSTKLHDSEEQSDALKRQIATLEDKLQAQQREINDNEYQRIQQLEASNAQLQQELAMLQRQHTQLQSEYKCLRERNKELPPIPEGAVVSLSSPWQLQQMLTNAQREIERLREEHERQLSEQEKAHRQQANILNRDIAQLESLIEAKIFKEADLMEALDHERKLVKRLLSDHRSSTGSASSFSSHQTHPSSRIHRRRETAIISISSAPSVDVPGIPEENDDDIPFCDICQESGHDLMSCSTILSQLPRTQQCNAIPNREKDTLVSFSEHSHVF